MSVGHPQHEILRHVEERQIDLLILGLRRNTHLRIALQRYLDSIEKADQEQQACIDPSAVQTELEKAGFMLVRQTALPAYNVQTAR